MTDFYPRITASAARDVAGQVHATGTRELMSTFDTTHRAAMGRWHYANKPTFLGLGVAFVSAPVPEDHPRYNAEEPHGVWCEADPHSGEVVALPGGVFALLLTEPGPEAAAREFLRSRVVESDDCDALYPAYAAHVARHREAGTPDPLRRGWADLLSSVV